VQIISAPHIFMCCWQVSLF